MEYVALLENDILGPDIYGLGSLDAYLPNSRSDNSVVYKKSLGPFTIGASYWFGRDSAGTGNSPGQGTCAGSVAGDFRQCTDWSAMLKYDAPTHGMVVSYEEQRGGTNAAYNFFDGVAPASLVKSGSKDTRMQANTYVKLLGAKIDGGWLGRRVDPANGSDQVHSTLFYLGVSYFATPFLQLDGEAARILNRDHDTRATLSAIRATYHLSKQSAVYAQAAYLSNSAHSRYTLRSRGPGST